MNARPLSPFLVYRFMYTMVLSFAHRVTGAALVIAALLLTYGLVALAGGEGPFERARRFFTHWSIRVVLLGLLVAFFYHLSNGIRHLVWDLGVGFEKAQARRSGWFVVASTVVMSGLALWIAARAGSGS
jgi:succinate dehydrogenase / fumarate reductase cytochrome b subunit